MRTSIVLRVKVRYVYLKIDIMLLVFLEVNASLK